MTETLFQKLEEKIITLLAELEDSQKALVQLKKENELLKSEKTSSLEKLKNLVTLLDSFDLPGTVSHENQQTAIS